MFPFVLSFSLAWFSYFNSIWNFWLLKFILKLDGRFWYTCIHIHLFSFFSSNKYDRFQVDRNVVVFKIVLMFKLNKKESKCRIKWKDVKWEGFWKGHLFDTEIDSWWDVLFCMMMMMMMMMMMRGSASSQVRCALFMIHHQN